MSPGGREPADGERDRDRDLVAIDDERTAVSALAYVPRLALGALADLRSIAEATRVLPDVARRLGSIQAGVESLDEEVRRMRQAVERIDGDVDGVAEAVAPLDSRLDELRQTLHPLSRFSARLTRRRGHPPEPGSDADPPPG